MSIELDDSLRARLIDYIAHLHIPQVKPVDGVISISAESMADALLPFVREEIERCQADDTEWCPTPDCVRPVTSHPDGMHLTVDGHEFGDPRPTLRAVT